MLVSVRLGSLCGFSCSGLVCTVRAESLSAVVIVVPCLSVAEVRSHFHAERLASPTPLVALDPSTLLWTMPTSNHQRQQRRAAARRAAVATDDVPDAVPRPQGRGPRNHFWDPRPPGVWRHNESNRTSAERRVSRAPAAATPPPSAADGGRESTRRGATRPSPSRLPPAAPRGVGCTALRDGPGGGERPLPPAWRTISPVEASL